jgi:hypothetical protein
MPAATGVVPRPVPRPGAELQLGGVPGYYLSSSVARDVRGTSIPQVALLIEPHDLIGVPGLVFGGRYVGDEDSGQYPEPLFGYRNYLDGEKRISLSGIGYGGRGSGDQRGASYTLSRIGAEAGMNVRMTGEARGFELHWVGALSVTGVWASGDYCVDSAQRHAVDCPDPPATAPKQSASAEGAYLALVTGVAGDIGRHFDGIFHGARLALTAAGGTMPRVVAREQQGAEFYLSGGVSLTFGFGATR